MQTNEPKYPVNGLHVIVIILFLIGLVASCVPDGADYHQSDEYQDQCSEAQNC